MSEEWEGDCNNICGYTSISHDYVSEEWEVGCNNICGYTSISHDVRTMKCALQYLLYAQVHSFMDNNQQTQHKKASNHHANLPLEMYSFTNCTFPGVG